jgi:hypothetical protein
VRKFGYAYLALTRPFADAASTVAMKAAPVEHGSECLDVAHKRVDYSGSSRRPGAARLPPDLSSSDFRFSQDYGWCWVPYDQEADWGLVTYHSRWWHRTSAIMRAKVS